MARTFLLMLLLIFTLGCKKNNDDGITVYKWKSDLYRGIVTNEKPAELTSSDPKINNSIYVRTDFVLLTSAQKNKQQDSIFKASARMLAYKYEKVKG